MKLRGLDRDNDTRRAIAQAYDRALEKSPIAAPTVPNNVTHVYHQYVVKSADRDRLARHLRSRSISTAIHYPVPVHRQPAYRGAKAVAQTQLPMTEQLSRQILSLPMYPQMTAAQVEQVADALTSFGGGGSRAGHV